MSRKMSKRGFELAISTMVIIILSIVVLIALILIFTGSAGKFWETVKMYFGSEIDSLKKACDYACQMRNNYDFCCLNRTADLGSGKEKITCSDERLNITCNFECEICK